LSSVKEFDYGLRSCTLHFPYFRKTCILQPQINKGVKIILDLKIMKYLLICAMLSVLAFAGTTESASTDKWEFKPGDCPTGLHRQPNGPFAVVLFCEDALGTYLAVVYLDPIGAPLTENGKWDLNNRYWHEPIWGSDVTGFQWSKDGTKLLVSTQGVYGAGGFFELDLRGRTFTQRLPKGAPVSIEKPGPGYTISGQQITPPDRR